MPRTRRIDFPGARHHVMNRGARRAAVLGDDASRALFLEVLADLPSAFGVRIHGWVLMPNHFHLMLETPEGNLSRAMRQLGSVFTQRLNARHGWDGPVFKGRFTNRVADDVRHWRHLLTYLHLNPVPSLVQRPEDWRWSSHRAYLGLEQPPDWLTTAEMLREYGGVPALIEEIEAHRTGRLTSPDFDAEGLVSPTRTDSIRTVDEEDVPFELVRAVAAVVQVTGRTEHALRVPRRGRHDNRARWVLAWWLERSVGLTHREIAHVLETGRGSVAQMLYRLRRIQEEDAEVAGWTRELEDRRRRRVTPRGAAPR